MATDNGDPYDMVAFPSKERKAFSGMALAIVHAKSGTAAGLAAGRGPVNTSWKGGSILSPDGTS